MVWMKEHTAIVGLLLSLIAAIFSFGLRIGSLTERIAAQQQQLELLRDDLHAMNEYFIAWVARHGG